MNPASFPLVGGIVPVFSGIDANAFQAASRAAVSMVTSITPTFCDFAEDWGGRAENYMGTSAVWRWGGGTAGGRHRVVAALPSMLSCFLFPAMCAVRWSGVTVCSSHQWLTFTNLRTFSVHIWSTGWNEAHSAGYRQIKRQGWWIQRVPLTAHYPHLFVYPCSAW